MPRHTCFIPGKDMVFIVQEAGWAPQPVWTGEENLPLTGVRSPDRPARSKSLYRLKCSGPVKEIYAYLKKNMGPGVA
jgi:hypothetical protein